MDHYMLHHVTQSSPPAHHPHTTSTATTTTSSTTTTTTTATKALTTAPLAPLASPALPAPVPTTDYGPNAVLYTAPHDLPDSAGLIRTHPDSPGLHICHTSSHVQSTGLHWTPLE
jgi:hypothetical protein